MHDEDNFELYMCEYRYKGDTWAVDVPAESFKDAQNRLKALSQGKVLGPIKGRVPYRFGWIAKGLVFLQNLLRGDRANQEE